MYHAGLIKLSYRLDDSIAVFITELFSRFAKATYMGWFNTSAGNAQIPWALAITLAHPKIRSRGIKRSFVCNVRVSSAVIGMGLVRVRP